MQITKIERQQKDKERYSLYIDGEFAFGVSEATLIQFGLYRRQLIDDATLSAIKDSEMGQRVYAKAIRYLSFRLRTEQELRAFLQKKLVEIEGANESKIESTIARLRQQGYLDDASYACHFVRDAALIARKGPMVIRQELIKKGIASTNIEIGLSEYSCTQQCDNLKYLADKWLRTNTKLPPKMAVIKLKQSLLTKGYSQSLIEEVINSQSFEMEKEEQLSRLAKEAEKLFCKRRMKYSGKQLVYKIREGLYQKGYDGDLIQQWLADNETMFLDE